MENIVPARVVSRACAKATHLNAMVVVLKCIVRPNISTPQKVKSISAANPVRQNGGTKNSQEVVMQTGYMVVVHIEI